MKSRLNNFILWCKNWYVSVNNEDMETQVLKILKLDGYEFAKSNDINPILLNFIDDLMRNNVIKNHNFVRLSNWNSRINHYMHFYKCEYKIAVLYTIREFFAWEIKRSDIELIPPTYNRRLFKMGFIAPKNMGNSYKMATHKAQAYFNKKFDKNA